MNNYNEFKVKATLKLKAVGFYKYIGEDDYKPPLIPQLYISQQVQGVDSTRNSATFTIPGSKDEVMAAKQVNKAWIEDDAQTLAIIVDACQDCAIPEAVQLRLKHGKVYQGIGQGLGLKLHSSGEVGL